MGHQHEATLGMPIHGSQCTFLFGPCASGDHHLSRRSGPVCPHLVGIGGPCEDALDARIAVDRHVVLQANLGEGVGRCRILHADGCGEAPQCRRGGRGVGSRARRRRGKHVNGNVSSLTGREQIGPQVVLRQCQTAEIQGFQPRPPRSGKIVRKHREDIAFSPPLHHRGHALGLQGMPRGRRVHRQQPRGVGVKGAVGLHHGDGLLQFAQTRHVEPHARDIRALQNRVMTFSANRHPSLGPSMAQPSQNTEQPSPQDTSNSQDDERHQYQYSLAARW